MFIGHYGFGLLVKKTSPAISLGVLFLAVQFADLLWPTLLLLNVEHVEIHPANTIPFTFTDYPISHSLLMSIVWSQVVGFIYWLFKKNARQAFIVGLCVLSHWILDLVVHIPDLPLYPGANAPRVGLGLWNYPVTTIVIESIMFLIGLVYYLRTTVAKNKTGNIVLWILIALLVLSHIANIFAPPPTSVTAVAWSAQLMWLFVILAFWADGNRMARKA